MDNDLFREKYEICRLAYKGNPDGYGCACEEIVGLYRKVHPERVFLDHTFDYALLTSVETCYFCKNRIEENPKNVHMLTTSEVSKMLHVHQNTLRRWCDQGKISAFKITGRGDRRFYEEDVKRFLRNYNPLKESK